MHLFRVDRKLERFAGGPIALSSGPDRDDGRIVIVDPDTYKIVVILT